VALYLRGGSRCRHASTRPRAPLRPVVVRLVNQTKGGRGGNDMDIIALLDNETKIPGNVWHLPWATR
jgi:hypothetical protein